MGVTSKAIVKAMQFWIVLPVLLSLINGLKNDAMAAEQPESPIDLILVMESTTGMKTTDPTQLRKQASKNAIALLDPQDRASVISFSGDGYPVAYLTSADSTKNIKTLFTAVDKLSAKGRHRNLHGALNAVKRVIERNPSAIQRQTHVVVFSIGAMQLATNNKSEKHVNDIKDKQLPWFEKNNVFIHSFAMGKKNNHNLLRHLSKQTMGRHEFLDNISQLDSRIRALLTEIKLRSNVEVKDQSFTINSGTISLNILQANNSEARNLTTPSGKKITAEDTPPSIRWINSDGINAAHIQKPEAGIWKFTGKLASVTAHTTNTTTLNYKLIPDKITLGDKLQIVAWLESDNAPVVDPAISQFIKTRLNINYADSSKDVVSLFPMKTQPGKFHATFKVEHAGATRFQLSMQDSNINQQVEFHRDVVPAPQQKNPDKPAANTVKAKPKPVAPGKPASETWLSQIEKKFPQLELALVILTLANGVFILFGLITYFMKRRLHQASTGDLATIAVSKNANQQNFHSELENKAA